ncbi:uncharacterized protein LOC120634259 isoform X2 [Pararge aegeria]|uniref:uncharacterized protein LOC120634259 isoform X2 n=1 Tax=Pararge aegeria TaxID=116150 RepID=UPI0019D215B4|nr:uncharacterized protein LOC120634259 isoform X2 [Pararge aegeria]
MSRPISRHSSRAVTIASSAEVFEVIREERTTPTPSSININTISPTSATVSPTAPASPVFASDYKPESEEENTTPAIICPCKAIKDAEQEKKNAEEIERLLKEKEIEMEQKFRDRVTHEIQYLKDRFEFILQNEQLRASHMLREAHRDREEKISALQTQLECKNMAGLMYVMCAERRKSRMEILRLTEEYTNYIRTLQQILEESQALILHLSRGYKTTARVNHEWQEKMKKIIKHFQNFVNNYTGGPPETNQYVFDLPNLLKIKTPIEDNTQEDSCDDEEDTPNENVPAIEPDRTWWNNLEGDDRPFVMFGDMADFKPPQRRAVLRAVKAQKTAPRKWKEYVFHDMFVKAECPHTNTIKDEYMKRGSSQPLDKWASAQTDKQTSSRGSDTSRRVTTASVDIRRNMGSILKIIASPNVPHTTTKSTILAARDSMEIASTTRLREKYRHASSASKIDSTCQEMSEDFEAEQDEVEEPEIRPGKTISRDEEDMTGDTTSALGSIHNDSLQVINQHVPEIDHKIHYEKICPMEKCQKMQMDDFMSSLPSYMRASPFTHFEQSFEDYEPCTPEQLEILKKRMEEKKKKERVAIDVIDDNPLLSWPPSVEGIAVQTSSQDMSIPPCTCDVAGSDAAEISQSVYNIVDLIPVKQELDRINAKCFFDDTIEFNRFKIIGQDENEDTEHENKNSFSKNRLEEIKKILKQYPSLCNIFQANIRC